MIVGGQPYASTLVVLFLLGAGASDTNGESLHIALDQASIRVYEPFSLSVSLEAELSLSERQRTDERGVPIAATRRRFYATLRDGSNTIVASALMSPEWETQNGAHDGVFRCRAIGIFAVSSTSETPRESGTPLEPGEYFLVLTDRGNSLRSDPIRIAVSSLNRREQLAADVVIPTYPDGIRFLLAHEGAASTIEAFGVVAQQYSDTYLGRLAVVALSLERAKSITKTTVRVHDQRRWEPIADDLAAGLGELAPDHALRTEALFQLSVARSACGKYAEARVALAQLEQVNPAGQWAWQGRRLAKELDQLKRATDQESER